MIKFQADDAECFFADQTDDEFLVRLWMTTRKNLILGLDTETNALDPWEDGFRVRLAQISDGITAWCVPPYAWLPELIRAHRQFCAHYSEAEIRFLGRDPVMRGSVRMDDLEPHIIDTQPMLAHYDPRTVITEAQKDGLDPRLPHPKGLKETYEREFSPILGQYRDDLYAWFAANAPKGHTTKQKSLEWGFANIPCTNAEYLRYGAMDAIAVKRLHDRMVSDPRVRSLLPHVDRDLKIQWDIDRMTFRGLPVDPPYVRWLNDQLSTVIRDNKSKLWLHGINPSGMGDAVGRSFAEQGVPPRKMTKGSEKSPPKPAWDKEVLKALAEEDGPGAPLARLLISSRQATKFQAAYLKPMMESLNRDAAVHCSFRVNGTTTHRNSAREPALQQLPKKDTRVRAAVGGRPGWVVVSCDLAQGEPRVMAALSGDPNYVAAVLSGDVNSATAAAAFGGLYNPAEGKTAGTASYTMRQGAKVGFLADCYTAGDATVAKGLGVPLIAGKAVRANWHMTYKVMHERAARLNTQEYVLLPSGRPVMLWDRKFIGPDGEVLTRPKPSRKALNYETQAFQADILRAAWMILRPKWAPFLAFFLHDEIVLFVPEWLAEEAQRDLQRAMTMPLGNSVTMECEATIDGRTWLPQPIDFDLRELESVDA